MSFQVFELGQGASTSLEIDANGDGIYGEITPMSSSDCEQQDRVLLDLRASFLASPSSPDGKLVSDLANDNEVLVCGNLTSTPFRSSFLSFTERMTVRVRSPHGRTGRGFLGRFKAVPRALDEFLTVHTEPNSSLPFTSLNFPMEPPPMANLSVSFIAPPQYTITLKVIGSRRCPPNVKSFLEIKDPYVGENGMTRIICHMKERTFPAYTIDDGDGTDAVNGANFATGNNGVMKNDDNFELVDTNNDAEAAGGGNGISLGNSVRIRSRFNRLDIKQVYLADFQGSKWNAQIVTTLGTFSITFSYVCRIQLNFYKLLLGRIGDVLLKTINFFSLNKQILSSKI